MGDPRSRDNCYPLAGSAQNSSHATTRHHSHAGNVSWRLIFDDANGMLPDLKRVQASLVELSGIPVVISETHLEQCQRDRLQAQRIPFICPDIQAYLPFMDEEYWSGKPNKQVKIYDPHKWAQFED